jgi:hypothetical protein
VGDGAARFAVEAATSLYFVCVDFVIHAANLLGVTYRDANAGLFFLLWPAVSVALAAIVVGQGRTLRRLRAACRARRRGRRPVV